MSWGEAFKYMSALLEMPWVFELTAQQRNLLMVWMTTQLSQYGPPADATLLDEWVMTWRKAKKV
jgi:hypothetical protein